MYRHGGLVWAARHAARLLRCIGGAAARRRAVVELAPALLVLSAVLLWALSSRCSSQAPFPSISSYFRQKMQQAERRLDGEIMANSSSGNPHRRCASK